MNLVHLGIIVALILLIVFIIGYTVRIIPQSRAYVVERIGAYHKTCSTGATAIGAAAGSLVAPPLGTVVGAGVGMLVSWGMNQDWGGGKSVTTWAKDSLKGLFN